MFGLLLLLKTQLQCVATNPESVAICCLCSHDRPSTASEEPLTGCCRVLPQGFAIDFCDVLVELLHLL